MAAAVCIGSQQQQRLKLDRGHSACSSEPGFISEAKPTTSSFRAISNKSKKKKWGLKEACRKEMERVYGVDEPPSENRSVLRQLMRRMAQSTMTPTGYRRIEAIASDWT